CAILGLVAGMELPEGPHSARPLAPLPRYVLATGLVLLVAAGAHFIAPTARAVHYTETGSMEKRYLHWDDAIAWYEAAIEVDPKYPRPHIKLGEIYWIKAQFGWGEEKNKEGLELWDRGINKNRGVVIIMGCWGDYVSQIVC